MTNRLAGFDAAAFLRDHWQRTPLLIRNPWDAWQNPLEPDELAGLAGEDGVEARLIAAAESDLQVAHGPLPAERFATLDRAPWTMLVQAVDQHVPAVAALLESFRFLPDWRIDDVMVSYAVDGGGVGAHFDHYDVFLIQGLGRRRWQVGAICDAATPLRPHDDLRLLQSFVAEQEWVLEPGDILYLPPGFSHDGVALGDDCMTYSIGFRAPSRAELVAAWCDEAVADMAEDDRYGDAGLVALQDNPGEITPAALDRLQAMVLAALDDRAGFARAFGCLATTPRDPDIDWSPRRPLSLKALRKAASAGASVERNPASRLSFIAQPDDETLLFVDGTCIACHGEVGALARQLCASRELTLDPALSDAAFELVRGLCNRGILAVERRDPDQSNRSGA